MIDTTYYAFIGAIRLAMSKAKQNPELLEVDEGGEQCRLPLRDGTWFVIERDHLDAVGGTSSQIAAAVYDVYRSDNRLR